MWIAHINEVLIPLNSGLVFTGQENRNFDHWQAVLIPLNSGLVFTVCGLFVPSWCGSLNPFEFRAGIY